jgi:hypothetical protein
MDTGFGNWNLYTACKLTFTHFYQENDHRYENFGTGFIVQLPSRDSRFALVTNRHLVDIPWAKPQYAGTVLESVKIEMWQSENFRLEFIVDSPELTFHTDQSIDVGVLPVGHDGFDTRTTKGTPYDKIENIIPDPNVTALVFNHAMSWEYLLKCEALWPQLRPGEFVTFPGYPKWYDRLQSRPVFRSGIISSDPHTNYRHGDGEPTNLDGNQQILFDAFSTSGNSGSPVFVAQRGLPPLTLQLKQSQGDAVPKQAANLEFTPYHESFLIGINAGHFNDTDSERPEDHAGLSRMHKLSAIMDILRTNFSESQEGQNVTIIIPTEAVDAYGGVPEGYLGHAPSPSTQSVGSPEPAVEPTQQPGTGDASPTV